MNNELRVLHICPDTFADPRHRYLGSTKDICCRTEYFQARNIPYTDLVVALRSDDLLLRELTKLDLAEYTTVVFELNLYPKSMTFLRRKAPHLRLVTRPGNAQFYHQLHMILARGWPRAGGQMRRLLREDWDSFILSLKRLRKDFLCTWRADYVLSIDHWEQQNYWKYMARSRKIRYAPYFSPHLYDTPRLQATKLDRCVCLTSTAYNPFLMDAIQNFGDAVAWLGEACPEWEFCVTGDFPVADHKLPARLVVTGVLESPMELLAGSRAMALLSDFGFGFKTKLLDAIQHDCFVLITPQLLARLPVELKPYCLVVNSRLGDSFKCALAKSREPYPEGNPNEQWRAQAYAALDEVLLK